MLDAISRLTLETWDHIVATLRVIEVDREACVPRLGRPALARTGSSA